MNYLNLEVSTFSRFFSLIILLVTFFNRRSLHVFITKLRRKLSEDERIRIINVRGVGYKLIVG